MRTMFPLFNLRHPRDFKSTTSRRGTLYTVHYQYIIYTTPEYLLRLPIDALDVQCLFGFSMPREAPALPTATGPPAASRSRQARPTRQPSVAPAKEGAPPSNSASEGRGKVHSRGRLARSKEKEGTPPKGGASIIFRGISLPGFFLSPRF